MPESRYSSAVESGRIPSVPQVLYRSKSPLEFGAAGADAFTISAIHGREGRAFEPAKVAELADAPDLGSGG